MVAKEPGELSLRAAARELGVSVKTVRTWARRAWEKRPMRLMYGRRDPSNRYYVSKAEIVGLRDEYRQRVLAMRGNAPCDPDAA